MGLSPPDKIETLSRAADIQVNTRSACPLYRFWKKRRCVAVLCCAVQYRTHSIALYTDPTALRYTHTLSAAERRRHIRTANRGALRPLCLSGRPVSASI